MPTDDQSFGVPTVQFAVGDDTIALPTLAATTVAQQAIALNWRQQNGPFVPLNGSYKAGIAMLGRDVVNKGYTFGIMSALPGSAIAVTASQGLLLRVTVANMPSGFTSAIGMGLFLQKGSANPQLAGFAYVDDTGNDFAFTLTHEPLLQSPRFTTGVLGAATASRTRGSALPKGVSWSSKTPTTGGVHMPGETAIASYDPDTGAQVGIPLNRSQGVEFSIYANDMENILLSLAGDGCEITDTNSDTVQFGESSLYAITSTLRENQAIKVHMPPDLAFSTQTSRLFLGNTQVNTTGVNESYTKNQVAQLDFRCAPISFDRLLNFQSTVLHYRRVT